MSDSLKKVVKDEIFFNSLIKYNCFWKNIIQYVVHIINILSLRIRRIIKK